MELVERVQKLKRTFDEPEDPNLPWFRRKKFIMMFIIGIAVVLGVAVLFFGGFFAGLSANRDNHLDSVPEPDARVIIRPIEWEGVCPKPATKCPESFQGAPPLLLISLDGFFPSLMDRGLTPTIEKIAKCGSHAPYMFPVFPTKTFPNHFSQVTGLYPSTHGIVDNNMYDPIKRKLFKVGTSESLESYWWLKEPIWLTAQKQGKKSGCFFWPGSEIKINGTYPTYYKKYNSKISFEQRADQILKWLDLPPSSRPNFLTLYVNEPDNALHHYGTNSKQTNNALSKVDAMINRLFSGLQQRNLINCINVVIMSDHGMSDMDCKRVIQVQNYFNVNDSFITAGPFGRIRPKGKRNETLIADVISKLRCQNEHMRVYPKEQLPVRMHYAESPRIEPIFVDIDMGWTLSSKHIEKQDSFCTGGSHGFDNLFSDMRAIFLAHGPSFKKNYTVQPFLNIELYEMFAEVIGIQPNPNNGTRGSMHHMMTSPKTLSPKQPESIEVADVPDEEDEYSARLSASTCNCPEGNKQRNVVNADKTRAAHLPFGIPHSDEEKNSLALLYNDDYVNAFSLKYKIPLWSSFTMTEESKYIMVEENFCWNGDARIAADVSPKCSDFINAVQKNQNILQRPLHHPGFSDASFHDQSTLITNAILKSLNHSQIVEKPLYNMLNKWVDATGEMNVVTGPAFDIFATGIKTDPREFQKLYEKYGPVLIPTHIFVIATWCSVKTDAIINCDASKLRAQGFLLPNLPYPNNCEDPASFIKKNVARIVDIENLTGITFYNKLPIYDAIRLRTTVPERPV